MHLSKGDVRTRHSVKNDLGEQMTHAKGKLGNPVLWPLAVLLTAALLLAALASSASAGSAAAGDGGKNAGSGGKGTNGAVHGKCKRKSKGAKSSAAPKSNGNGNSGANKKKCGKRKPGPGKTTPPSTTPVTPPATPPSPPPSTPPSTPPATPPATTTLAIDPASFDFGSVPHGGFSACLPDPDPDCPTHAFTVTNTGGAASGVPTASIVELKNPEIGGPAAFAITANTCTAALAPGASCSITVRFAPNSNAGDEMFSSRLDVNASPGTPVSSALSGMGT